MTALVFRPHQTRAAEDLAEAGQRGLQVSRQRVSLLHEKRMGRTSPQAHVEPLDLLSTPDLGLLLLGTLNLGP